MSEPREVTPNVPPDWRDWVNDFPTMKSLAVFCFCAWVVTPTVMIVTGWLIGSGFVAIDESAAILALFDKWLDALNWLTLAAVFGVVGKFATTKPEVVRAEGEVKAAQVVAAAQAAAIVPPPAAPVLTNADAQLAAKTLEARQQALAAQPVGTSVPGEGD